MPELPEVETIRRQLEKLVIGKTVSLIEVLNRGSFRAKKDGLIGESVARVGRHGKVLILDLKRSDPGVRQGRTLGNPHQLFIHLKMSGRLEFVNQNISNSSKKAWPFLKRPGLSKPKHLRVAIDFTDGSFLLFHDQRKFGWISDDPAVLPQGIDALDSALSLNKLAEILGQSSRPIKQILLDQSKIAGLGNIYASEILWQAKVNPLAKGFSVINQKSSSKLKSQSSKPKLKAKKLRDAIEKILYEAIKYGGSTMTDNLYRRADGEIGGYQNRFKVYNRAGEPCRRPACRQKNSIIRKITIGQRSTYFCPNCQS